MSWKSLSDSERKLHAISLFTNETLEDQDYHYHYCQEENDEPCEEMNDQDLVKDNDSSEKSTRSELRKIIGSINSIRLKSLFKKMWNPKPTVDFCRKYNIPQSTMCSWLKEGRRKSLNVERRVKEEIEVWLEEKSKKSEGEDPITELIHSSDRNELQRPHKYLMKLLNEEYTTQEKTNKVEVVNPKDITKMKLFTRKIKFMVFIDYPESPELVIDRIENVISSLLFFEIHGILFLPHRFRIDPDYLSKFWLDVLADVRYRRTPVLYMMLVHINNLSLLLNSDIPFFVLSKKDTIIQDLKSWSKFYITRDFLSFSDIDEFIKAIRERISQSK